MTPSILNFFERCVSQSEIEGKEVIEVGSKNVNGSVRSIIEKHDPKNYTGIDIQSGDGVDVIADICDMEVTKQYDVVIATELLEHIKQWRLAVNNIRKLCKHNGLLFVTTRSKGFKYHPYPHDYWRYEVADIANIFRDMKFLVLEPDPLAPGVFMKAVNYDCSNNFLYDLYAVHQHEPQGYSGNVPYLFEKVMKEANIPIDFKEVGGVAFTKKDGKATIVEIKP